MYDFDIHLMLSFNTDDGFHEIFETPLLTSQSRVHNQLKNGPKSILGTPCQETNVPSSSKQRELMVHETNSPSSPPSNAAHQTMNPSLSNAHQTMVPSSSHAHDDQPMVPLLSPSSLSLAHQPLIPTLSHAHETMVPSSSYAHYHAMEPSTSYAHEAMEPSTPYAHEAMAPPSSYAHEPKEPSISYAHEAMVPSSTHSQYDAMEPSTSYAHEAIVPSSCTQEAMVSSYAPHDQTTVSPFSLSPWSVEEINFMLQSIRGNVDYRSVAEALKRSQEDVETQYYKCYFLDAPPPRHIGSISQLSGHCPKFECNTNTNTDTDTNVASSSSKKRRNYKKDPPVKKTNQEVKVKAWTKFEHRLFLVGKEYYCSNTKRNRWHLVSEKILNGIKSPSQVSSHAQKFYEYQNTKKSGASRPLRRPNRNSQRDSTFEEAEVQESWLREYYNQGHIPRDVFEFLLLKCNASVIKPDDHSTSSTTPPAPGVLHFAPSSS